MVSYLLKSGADPTLPDTGLRTCMHHAVMGQSPECIQELLKHKVGGALLRSGWLSSSVPHYCPDGAAADHTHNSASPFVGSWLCRSQPDYT